MRRLDHLLDGPGAPTAVLAEGDRRIDAPGLAALAARVAGALAALAAPGDRVAIWLPKSIEMAAALMAASRAGLVAVPLNPALRAAQVRHAVADSGATLLLTAALRASGLELASCRILLVERDWPELAAGPPHPDTAPGDEVLALLLYTSGSTGLPKGVMVTHANLLTGARSVASYLGTTPEDRILAVLPLSFDFGLSQLTTGLLAGATVELLDHLTARDILQAVAARRITQLAAVPPLWSQLAALDWADGAGATLATLSTSGGRLPVPVVRRLRALFPHARLHLMYGLTEAFRSTTLAPELVDQHPDSIGRAIPDAEVLVVRPDGSLADDGEAGELVHCGPLVTRGYWGDPQRTAARFRPAPPASRHGGTAVWSGDRVVRDSHGLIRFVGRDDEMIKTMGVRVSPTEVEEMALQSGAVAAAVAVGLADPAAGMRIVLAAVLAPDTDSGSAEQVLRHHFRREAPPWLHPAEVRWLPELPLSPNGKVDRAAIRASLAP